MRTTNVRDCKSEKLIYRLVLLFSLFFGALTVFLLCIRAQHIKAVSSNQGNQEKSLVITGNHRTMKTVSGFHKSRRTKVLSKSDCRSGSLQKSLSKALY